MWKLGLGYLVEADRTCVLQSHCQSCPSEHGHVHLGTRSQVSASLHHSSQLPGTHKTLLVCIPNDAFLNIQC